MDPAEGLDNAVSWWDREKFKVGIILGYAVALLQVWWGS